MFLTESTIMPQCMPLPSAPPLRQRGVSLIIVLIFVMLTMLLTLWASRTALFNEMVVGNDADWQRSFEAAQTLLQDAELDIHGMRANGSLCTPGGGSGSVCRASGVLQFPLELGGGKDGVFALFDALEPLPEEARCKDALCLKPKRDQRPDFWNDKSRLKKMQEAGARYGTYTGAKVGSSDSPGNPILAETGSDKGGWYWVEVMRLNKDSEFNKLIADYANEGKNAVVPLNTRPPVVYRITALANGRKPHTQVVLQEVYVVNKLKD